MKINRKDINSILPIIIKIIKLIFEDINKLEKFKFCNPYISELTVFVKARIESLKDLSKPILSKTKKLDSMNILKKKEINIKKEIFTFSSVILFSELKIVFLFLQNMCFGNMIRLLLTTSLSSFGGFVQLQAPAAVLQKAYLLVVSKNYCL